MSTLTDEVYNSPLEKVKNMYIDALDGTDFFERPNRSYRNFIAVNKNDLVPCQKTPYCQNLYRTFKTYDCVGNDEKAYKTIPLNELQNFRDRMHNCMTTRADYTYDCCGGRTDRGHMLQVLLANDNRVGSIRRMKLKKVIEEADTRLRHQKITRKKLEETFKQLKHLPPKKRFLLDYLRNVPVKLEFKSPKKNVDKKSPKKNVDKKSPKKNVDKKSPKKNVDKKAKKSPKKNSKTI